MYVTNALPGGISLRSSHRASSRFQSALIAQTRFRSVLIARTRTKQIKFSISTVQIAHTTKQYGSVGKVDTGRPEVPSSILAQCIL